MDVIVIGAGLGGLATARRLLADGHRVRVFEQASERRTGGAGLGLFCNGQAVLHDLGVRLDGLGQRLDRIDARTAGGTLRTRVNLVHAAQTYGFDSRAVSRAELVERLSEGLPADLVAYGKACTGVSQTERDVTATFADGTSATADLLIAADGHHSAVRRQLWGDGAVVPATFGTWQGRGPMDTDITDTHLHYMITGKEGACGLMPAGGGLVQWWFDVRWQPGDPRPEKPLEDLRRRFGHWASPIPEVLAAATDDTLGFFGHHWNKVRPVWGEGRVTLLGDAAHTMPPTLGQGANQSFEDVWVLGKALAAAEPAQVPERLREYERARYPHAALVSRMAKRNPANQRIPAFLGRRIPETSYTRLLRKFSNRLSEAG
ncbi:FAD-dependent monooxygenase [Catenulispora sp. NF23]|uniref:FAD-dependent monooxygenase n=1 Tax=Catenulispora pinistramenti TaxID=2705254 RepID=A0ABS5KM12_9ACTN|nr:FAD-dependent monooxygenase [Catenulispora pinistramenti]MBS2534283.1 FAD-dependent monooxygenase [Catenulispora pinistramenti]MBS2547092.1 FAD-dependent monooxygenase [Catenulispora pinistramenti]